MTRALVVKLLRDVRLGLIMVALLLAAFQCLWAKITERVTGQLVPFFAAQVSLEKIQAGLFTGSGKIMQTLMGGESISIQRAMDILSIGYVHPLVQAMFCIWAIGRASSAIAGEIDRGTMELLLAQPLPRWRVIAAHFCVDVIAIPILCLCLWGGTWLGTWLVGPIKVKSESVKDSPIAFILPEDDPDPNMLTTDPSAFGPALWNVAALVFAVSGYTIFLSASGRNRGRVMGAAVFLTLVQFLVNVVGQLWVAVAWVRPFTVFYYYQPQQIVLQNKWYVDLAPAWRLEHPLNVPVLLVLFLVGGVGYGLALWVFCRRDLPAPL